MSIRPTSLKLVAENQLRIDWNDGMVREYTFRELRDHCPCATCREQRRAEPDTESLLPILSASEAQPLKVLGMEPVGNYAYTIHFSDGHYTGIFEFTLLRQLGKELTDDT